MDHLGVLATLAAWIVGPRSGRGRTLLRGLGRAAAAVAITQLVWITGGGYIFRRGLRLGWAVWRGLPLTETLTEVSVERCHTVDCPLARGGERWTSCN